MNAFINIIIALQVVSALVIIGLVLLQHGKGADMGAAFGSGASGSLFGATGSSNFLSKSTGAAAAIFFAATLALAFLGTKQTPTSSGGVMESLQAPATAPAPAASAPAASAPAAAAPKAAGVPAAAGSKPAASAPASSAGQSNQIPK